MPIELATAPLPSQFTITAAQCAELTQYLKWMELAPEWADLPQEIWDQCVQFEMKIFESTPEWKDLDPEVEPADFDFQITFDKHGDGQWCIYVEYEGELEIPVVVAG